MNRLVAAVPWLILALLAALPLPPVAERAEPLPSLAPPQVLAPLPTEPRPLVTDDGLVEAAHFQVGFPPTNVTFVIRLTDPDKIQHAQAIIAGTETRNLHVMGAVTKARAAYNPAWSYHLDPDSITFFQAAIEVCDADPLYLEEHLAEACGAFLPGCVWCPWSSRLTGEVQPSRAFLPSITS